MWYVKTKRDYRTDLDPLGDEFFIIKREDNENFNEMVTFYYPNSEKINIDDFNLLICSKGYFQCLYEKADNITIIDPWGKETKLIDF